MENQHSRTELILGKEALAKLRESRVAVFGLGGVGGYCVEALARSSVGTLDIVDMDRISITNLNRQIFATHRTVGLYKVDAAQERIYEISPGTVVNKIPLFYCEDTANHFDFTHYDYIIDAIDTVTSKLLLVLRAQEAGTAIISSMGMGNKLDASALRVADIYKTRVCPLARVMRYELRKKGIKHLKVVYSEETPIVPTIECRESESILQGEKSVPGSAAFVPAAAGLIIAGEVVKDLID
ncbi:MAG: tRNA threonylcarbamoyladenosine dehydratase [Firmicutes bacterium ADurb.Bin300]|nr:MAG: tRNA threonylcarbamoyladenosine dehydratase [Firmicutes bacterium ADurb.Bin300]HOD02367.1 tRNA threonylcarbamoyladenosine dehydratase [Clostridiales bacterium]